jgi:aminocarboxymuconate-semialdehyde decarboxylase
VIVDIHTHFIPAFVMEEAQQSGGCMGVTSDGEWLVHPEGFRYPITPTFADMDAKLAMMDDGRIDVSVLSIAPTLFFYDADAQPAVQFARRANDALAELTSGDDRLHGLATLPLQDPEAAAAELERSVTDLGLRGAQIGHDAGRRTLDDPELEPVMEACARLDVPLMLHPSYVGLAPGLEDYYFTNSIGNPLLTTIAAARLIHGGIFDRLPNLKVVLVHAGGFLPYQIGRFDHAHAVRTEPRRAIERPPSSYLDRFWMDTITHGDEALQFLAGRIGTERLVVGTDLPFDMADEEPVQRLERLGIDGDALGSTALALLGVNS